jgi:hypothetical protein
MEKLETTWDSTHNTSLVSPNERIKQLTEGNGKAHSWSTWGDAWVTIRSNKSSKEQEMVSCSEDYNMAYANGSIENSGAEIASLSMEYNFVVLNEPTSISGNNTCNNTSSGGSCRDDGRHKILLMPCEGRKDALCKQFEFCEGNKVLFSTSQCLACLSSYTVAMAVSNYISGHN